MPSQADVDLAFDFILPVEEDLDRIIAAVAKMDLKINRLQAFEFWDHISVKDQSEWRPLPWSDQDIQSLFTLFIHDLLLQREAWPVT